MTRDLDQDDKFWGFQRVMILLLVQYASQTINMIQSNDKTDVVTNIYDKTATSLRSNQMI